MSDIIITIGPLIVVFMCLIPILAWRRMRERQQKEVAIDVVEASAEDPYRTQAEGGDVHGPGCDGCEQLEAISYRWKAPDDLLAYGYPVQCISHKTKISELDLHALAEEVGLVRQ